MARKKTSFKLISLRKRRRSRPKKKKIFWKVLLILFIVFVSIPSIIAYLWFKKNILDKLPNVNKIENVVFSQTTTITDRNGIVLYKVFNENRKYVKLDKISENMQNAIIAIEDKNFWKNPWIDIQWIIRAWLQDVIFGKRQWASTLTQQLIKNIILTNKKTIKRKLKEIVLAFKLNKYLANKIKKQYKGLSDKEIKRKVKEKILEMYLNYVFFWNNAYGVEAAANTYFHKSADKLSVLEASILASIPKSPVKYDPLRNRKNNIWYLSIKDENNENIELTWSIKNNIEKIYINYLKDQNFALAKDENDMINMIVPKNLKLGKLQIDYTPWRKDFVLARMYLDNHINKAQLIEAIKEWLNIKIYSPKIEIKAPHFVFYVLNQLEKKYGKDVISKAWWTIKTSLDYNIQKTAEQTIKDRSNYLLKKWANNSALLYVNSKNWDIIAYVGSKDYNNKKIDGKVDIITSKRQCWSTIKPLIYAKAFIEHRDLTPDSPIYDTKLNIAKKWHTFNNFDWKFMGLMPIKKALAYSRNIPAAKMYFLGWGERKVKAFLQALWLKTISNKIYYGYPLAIWAAEVRMIDFAQAYIQLSNIDEAVNINPILEIRNHDGSIIYKKKISKRKQIIPKSVIYMMWSILSDPANRPPSWNKVEQVPQLTLATKSWTTNIIDKRTWKKYPRDGWFVAYSPSKVFVVWAWNTKWEHMHSDAFWWWTAWKIWKDFVIRLKKAKKIHNESMLGKWTTNIYINELNGKKSTSKTPVQVTVKTVARLNWIPKADDGKTIKMIELDTMCNWLVSEYTPITDKKYWYIIKAHSQKPRDPKWENPVQEWWKKTWKEKFEKILWWPILFEEPKKECEDRLILAKLWKLKFNIISPRNWDKKAHVFNMKISIQNAPFKIKKYQVFVDDVKVDEEAYNWKILWIYIPNNVSLWLHKVKIRLIDEKWYIDEKTLNLYIIKDNDKPYLYKKYENNWKYYYVFKDNSSKILWWLLICNWKKTRFRGNIAIWDNWDCSYSMVIDYYWNYSN